MLCERFSAHISDMEQRRRWIGYIVTPRKVSYSEQVIKECEERLFIFYFVNPKLCLRVPDYGLGVQSGVLSRPLLNDLKHYGS